MISDIGLALVPASGLDMEDITNFEAVDAGVNLIWSPTFSSPLMITFAPMVWGSIKKINELNKIISFFLIQENQNFGF